MKANKDKDPPRLEDLPNIGKNIAADLRRIGIRTPADLKNKSPIRIYQEMESVMGARHDPCVLYTLLSVRHYFLNGESIPWWKFTKEGQELIRSSK